MQLCTSTCALGKGTGLGPRGSPRKSRWVGDPILRSRGRELCLHEVAGLSHQTHCDEDAERTAGTEGEGGPRVAGGSQVRGHRRTPASRAPLALPNSSVRASLHLQGAQQAQTGLRDTDTTGGGCAGAWPGWGLSPRGRVGRRWTEEGLNSSPPGIWHLEILSQSRRHTHAR